jgi:hypothetical protein
MKYKESPGLQKKSSTNGSTKVLLQEMENGLGRGQEGIKWYILHGKPIYFPREKNSQNKGTVGSIYPQFRARRYNDEKEFLSVEVQKRCPPSVTAVTTKNVKSGWSNFNRLIYTRKTATTYTYYRNGRNRKSG